MTFVSIMYCLISFNATVSLAKKKKILPTTPTAQFHKAPKY